MGRPSIIDKYKRYLKNTPVWVRAISGVVAILMGLWLFTKPFYSLTLMVIMLAAAIIIDSISRLSRTGAHRWLGVPMLLGGLLVLLLPGISVQLISLIVGIGIIVSGSSDIITAIKGAQGARLTAAIKGVSMLMFGALALIWQDMTLLILSFAFGFKLVITGISLLINLHKKKTTSRKTKETAIPTFKKIVGGLEAAFLLLLALGLMGIGIRLHEAAPIPDAFYSWSGEIPTDPGQLLRYEAYTQAVPEGVRGWRILYSTTRDEDGTPAVASAFVMAPQKNSSEPQPIVAWAHGTTGIVPGCAPTVMKEPFPLDSTVPAVEQAFSNGWVMVGTDYVGLGTEGPHPYLIGQGEARSVLDSVRAAKQLPGLNLANKTVIWGHSQGGNAALWAGGLAESYAPDVNVIGVAAAAPATELPELLEKNKYSPVGKIMGSFALKSYSEIYPEVSFNEYVNPFLKPVVEAMAGRCLSETSSLLSLAASLAMPGTIYGKSPMDGVLGQRLNKNVPTLHIGAELFIAQGEADPLVLPEIQQAYTSRIRAAGQELKYKTYPGLDHLTLVDKASPYNADLEAWTKSIFASER